MTEQNVEEAAFNFSLLDQQAWEEPKELIPVQVVKSRLRWSAPEYNRATSFRQAFPTRGPGFGPEGNSIQQWDFQLKRLDAVYSLPDGTEADVIIYAGCDLEKLDNKTGVLKPLMKTRGKEQTVITGWNKAVGSLVPNPERLEGMFFMVERFREKEISAGFFAKNVVLPVETLAPTFVYSGPVQRFDAKREVAGGPVAGAEATSTGGVSREEAAVLIATFLKEQGIDRTAADVTILSHPSYPQAARIEPFQTAAATGKLDSTLASFGV